MKIIKHRKNFSVFRNEEAGIVAPLFKLVNGEAEFQGYFDMHTDERCRDSSKIEEADDWVTDNIDVSLFEEIRYIGEIAGICESLEDQDIDCRLDLMPGSGANEQAKVELLIECPNDLYLKLKWPCKLNKIVPLF